MLFKKILYYIDPNQPELTCKIYNSNHGHNPNKITYFENMSLLFLIPYFLPG